MITIDKVEKQRYSFPTIDFKFQNSGNATAFLWKFAVNVLSAEIDITPVLDFDWGVEKRQLEVSVTNNGWGVAKDCTIDVDERTLTRLFDKNSLRFSGSLASGESKPCFCLSVSDVPKHVLQAIERDFSPLMSERDSSYYGSLSTYSDNDLASAIGIKLKNGHATCRMADERGNTHTQRKAISFARFNKSIALTRTGFVEMESEVHACIAQSDTTYISLIDPQAGSHERIYPMSRKVPPGDIERFHIMVGASKSCRLQLQFKFFVDKESVVESNRFDIHIVLPRNNEWMLHEYKDGSELPRDIDELKRRYQGGGLSGRIESELEDLTGGKAEYMSGDWEKERHIQKIKQLEKQASEFPFSQDR
jgi:hypothetical protein